MRFLIIVLVVIALLVFYYYIHISSEINNIDYKINIKDVDFSNFNLQSFGGEGSLVKTKIGVDLKNNGSLSLSFKDLYIEVYYGGILVAKSSDNVNNQNKIIIDKNSSTNVVQEFDVYVNQSLFNLIKGIKNKNALIQYKVNVNWYGFKISHEGTYKYN